MRVVLYITSIILLFSCTEDLRMHQPQFVLRDNLQIGCNFRNDITSKNDFNVYKYRNFYNGGGVAIGDVNNDGLVDIYFVSNQNENKLFLNKGDFQFEDITKKAGVAGVKAWSTGVTFADINGDGYLDIYVCNSGDLKGDDKESELFVNNGDLTFTESAKQYGLNDKGYSTHASFFDYDRDGDLDVYLLNNSYAAIGSFNLRKNQRPIRDELGGDKLLRNDGDRFTDVSEAAGIYGSEIGFGLGVTVSDFNNDNWMDIFISNDFFERDYLYMNQGDGTFKEDLVDKMHSISAASMGADAADINNDGYTDLFVTDMLPYDYERLKTVTTFDDWNRYSYNVKNDYHYQFTRNVLQLNQKGLFFTELSRMMNVQASDWSWGALFFDMDNDGFRDLFVGNGIYKDLTNQDYLEYIANESIIQSIVTEEGVNYKELIDIIPSNKVKNMAFRNINGVDFQLDDGLGLSDLSFSNGAAYGDLDNDGDLDLVVNNINMPCFIYENTGNNANNYIRIVLAGEGQNRFGIGARITIATDTSEILVENVTCKGFQSTVDHRMTIGLGQANKVRVTVDWPSGKQSIVNNVTANQEIEILESQSINAKTSDEKSSDINIFTSTHSLPYINKQRDYSDFNQERLIFWMRSNEGGRIAIGDVNGDGFSDIVLPGARGEATEVWISSKSDGGYAKLLNPELEADGEPEYLNAQLKDMDGDNDLDLLLASGSVEHSQYSPFLIDKVYLNNGQGVFSRNKEISEVFSKMSTSALIAFDYDQDGDEDLLATERIKGGQVGKPCSSHLYENIDSTFRQVTIDIAPGLQDVGMVTSADVVDIDQDGDQDIILVGECMPITIFENSNGKFSKVNLTLDKGLHGWWSALHIIDIDADGDMDILAGNQGTNSRFKANKELPIYLFYGDFDSNGFGEGILCKKSIEGEFYPYSLRHNLIDQMKSLKKVFPDFESFKSATMADIFGQDKLDKATKYVTDNLHTTLLLNEGGMNFKSIPLPPEVQYTNVNAIATSDFDHDGDLDIVMGGNHYKAKPEVGISDASRGLYLENLGNLKFEAHLDQLNIPGEIRDMKVVNNQLLININNDSLKILTF